MTLYDTGNRKKNTSYTRDTQVQSVGRPRELCCLTPLSKQQAPLGKLPPPQLRCPQQMWPGKCSLGLP